MELLLHSGGIQKTELFLHNHFLVLNTTNEKLG
jgi:hypothetical protein